MNLSVKDAATHLGCSPRTLRAMLLDGRITGYKRGGRWVIPRRNLPLTDAQRRKVEHAVGDLHAAVDDAVPAHLRRQLGGGVAELRAFGCGRAAPSCAPSGQRPPLHRLFATGCARSPRGIT